MRCVNLQGTICLNSMIPNPMMMIIREYFQYCSFVLIEFVASFEKET